MPVDEALIEVYRLVPSMLFRVGILSYGLGVLQAEGSYRIGVVHAGIYVMGTMALLVAQIVGGLRKQRTAIYENGRLLADYPRVVATINV